MELPLDRERFERWWVECGSDRVAGDVDSAFERWRADACAIADGGAT